jgi:hypothetical protein
VVMCQYEGHLKFHFLGHFCGLMGNVFASGFQGYVVCIHVGSVVSSIVYTCAVERNGDVKSAVCHGEGMRCRKTGSKEIPLIFSLLCVCVCVCACAQSQGPVLLAVLLSCVFYGDRAALQ